MDVLPGCRVSTTLGDAPTRVQEFTAFDDGVGSVCSEEVYDRSTSPTPSSGRERLDGRKRTPVGTVPFGSATQAVILNATVPVTVG